jgi:PAS domain S-box-containing protein
MHTQKGDLSMLHADAAQKNSLTKTHPFKTGILFLLIMVMSGAVFFYMAKAYVLSHAEKEIRNLLLEHKGLHKYVQEVMHPALYRYQANGEFPKAFYAPELFSSSYIVRNQHKLYNEERERLGLPPLYYKMTAKNPRNPVNLADPMETRLINMFNADRTQVSHREIITIDGTSYLYVAIPFLANTQACLKCHGRREDAPLQLQARYPGQGGFNEKLGEIRAITSIKAPLQKEFTAIFIIVASVLVGMLGIAVLFLFNSRLRHLVTSQTQSLVMEIDERKRAEAQTALSFERFKAVLDSMDSLVYVADMDTYELLFINQFGRDTWGEITGQICWQVLQNDQSGPCPFCTNSRLLDENKKPTGIYVWEFQNTVDKEWYECRDQAIQWTNGRQARMEIATNITQRKRMHQSLAEEKELLAVTLRSIGDGVITTDISGRVILINKVAEMLTGWSQRESVGCRLTEVFNIIDEITQKKWDNPVERILESESTVELFHHVILLTRSGIERRIAFSGSPIRDDKSRTIGMVLAFRDITEQLRTEQELIKVKKLESIGVLAGGIAHDFNNILSVILGNIDFALSLSDSNMSSESRELLDEAMKASLRAQGLTQQLLTFAKGGEPVKETASLADVIMESANFILHGDKVACRYDFPPSLWLVDIDKGQISQVVQNIILNASQSMPGGGMIDVSCENVTASDIRDFDAPAVGRFVKVTIMDRGIGIPANILERIFDPYFSTKQKGSGLGLAITHSIISKHNGYISVSSTPGTGTTFTIYLPASGNGSAMAKKVEMPETTGQKARIMVMDDEEQILKLTNRMLSKMGHEVILAVDGAEAVRLYKEAFDKGTPMDLVIMDLTIPGGMGGQEAVKEILSVNPNAKVLVSSGYSTDPVMASYSEFGFCGALVKPFQLSELKKTLKKMLSDTL